MRKAFVQLIGLLFIAGCATTEEGAEQSLPSFPITEPISIHWSKSQLAEPTSSIYDGFRSIDELVPEIDGSYGVGLICGGVVTIETPEFETRVDLKALGASEVWIPLQGSIRKTLYFDFSR